LIAKLAALYLAMFARQEPAMYKANPPRIATLAVASAKAHEAIRPRWRWGDAQLMGAIGSGLEHESHLAESVHAGTKRGPAGGICVGQIHHTNGLWKRTGAPSFEALAGTDLQASTWCLHTVALSLVSGASYCHKRHFYTYWSRAMWTMYATGRRCHPWSRQAYKRSKRQAQLAATTWRPTPEHERLISEVLEQDNGT